MKKKKQMQPLPLLGGPVFNSQICCVAEVST